MESEGCEHLESAPIGKCAICDRTVCSDCYREVFTAMICDMHEALEDEGEWQLVGFYSESVSLEDRRYLLEEQGITSLVVEGDGEAIELYVPVDEKDDAFASLSSAAGDESHICAECDIEFSADIEECPLCGTPAGQSDEHDDEDRDALD